MIAAAEVAELLVVGLHGQADVAMVHVVLAHLTAGSTPVEALAQGVEVNDT